MDKQLMKVARAIHMARIDECSFPGHPGFTGRDAAMMRQPWPEDRKEATRLFYERTELHGYCIRPSPCGHQGDEGATP